MRFDTSNKVVGQTPAEIMLYDVNMLQHRTLCIHANTNTHVHNTTIFTSQ